MSENLYPSQDSGPRTEGWNWWAITALANSVSSAAPAVASRGKKTQPNNIKLIADHLFPAEFDFKKKETGSKWCNFIKEQNISINTFLDRPVWMLLRWLVTVVIHHIALQLMFDSHRPVIPSNPSVFSALVFCQAATEHQTGTFNYVRRALWAMMQRSNRDDLWFIAIMYLSEVLSGKYFDAVKRLKPEDLSVAEHASSWIWVHRDFYIYSFFFNWTVWKCLPSSFEEESPTALGHVWVVMVGGVQDKNGEPTWKSPPACCFSWFLVLD